jgi:hypothetical protein
MALISKKKQSHLALADIRSFLEMGRQQFEWQSRAHKSAANIHGEEDENLEDWAQAQGIENLETFDCLNEVRRLTERLFYATRRLAAVGHVGSGQYKPCALLIRFSRRFCANNNRASLSTGQQAGGGHLPPGMEQVGRALLILLENQVSASSSQPNPIVAAGTHQMQMAPNQAKGVGGNFSLVHIKRTMTKRLVPRLMMFNPVI